MTEPAAEGSVDAPAIADAPAGNPEVQPAVADNGSPAPAESDPFSGLSEGNRGWVETKGFKSADDIAKSYQQLEQRLGTSLTPPKDDAPTEEWDKFYGKLGRPETPDAYDLKRPEGLPEEMPWNADAEGEFKKWAHADGLTAKQAQGQLSKFAQFQAEQFKAAQAAQAEAVETTHSELTKEWGAPDSEGFKTKLAMADRAMRKLGLTEAYQKSGLILADGSVTDPQIAKAFAAIGETMFKEDTIGSDPLPTGGNPFKPGPNGERQITAISALIKNDPEQAKRLAREAGENPLDWGLGKR